MSNYILGGTTSRWTPESPCAPAHELTEVEAPCWRHAHPDGELFLHASGDAFQVSVIENLAIAISGYAVFDGAAAPTPHRDLASLIRKHYRDGGELPLDRMEGSFTLALLDGRAGRVLLYRNLVGSGVTYYTEAGGGLSFGSNLADLVDACGRDPQPNRAALPAFFLYRCVPGRETLFEDFYRLLPGELLVWERGVLRRTLVGTLGGLPRTERDDGDAVQRLDATLGRVVSDCAVARPQLANLLSGGVDSSYLQILWRQACPSEKPTTFSVGVDHPSTRAETEYALSAARVLGTQHTIVAANDSYSSYLLDTIAATGEPPNHVQAAYFGHLARCMTANGFPVGLCGEGADNLFGLPQGNRLQYGALLRRLLPFSCIRQSAHRFATSVGWNRLRDCLWLADHDADWEARQHPVNRVSVFTNWEAVLDCFGESAVDAALAERRSLLERYDVPADPMQRMHACGYLTDAADTAALWATLFHRYGGELLCPFMDSRVLRLVVNLSQHERFPFRQPKGLLRRALARRAARPLSKRPKRGFGQPVFEWLAPKGQLRPLVDALAEHDFLPPAVLARERVRPTWFLYSLLCYDLWHKLFIERSLPRVRRLPLSSAALETVAWMSANA